MILHTAITEYVRAALLRFLADTRDGAVGVSCIDPQMGGNGPVVLVPFPPGFRREVQDIVLLEIFGGCDSDPVAPLVAYC